MPLRALQMSCSLLLEFCNILHLTKATSPWTSHRTRHLVRNVHKNRRWKRDWSRYCSRNVSRSGPFASLECSANWQLRLSAFQRYRTNPQTALPSASWWPHVKLTHASIESTHPRISVHHTCQTLLQFISLHFFVFRRWTNNVCIPMVHDCQRLDCPLKPPTTNRNSSVFAWPKRLKCHWG